MVYAATVTGEAVNPLGNSTVFGENVTLGGIFGFIMNVVMGIGIALTVIYLILGGIKYVTSQGDQKNTQQAREWLTSAVIGFIVVIGAFAIRSIVGELLGAQLGGFTGVSDNLAE